MFVLIVDPPVRGDDEGVNVYLDQCKTYKIIPLKRVLRSFTTPYMNLKVSVVFTIVGMV